jgi:hypothetical protein
MTQQLIDVEDDQLNSPSPQTQTPAAHVSSESHLGESIAVMVLWLIVISVGVLYVAETERVDIEAMTGFGLITVLPVTMLASIAGLIVSFIVSLALPRQHPWLLLAHLVLLVVMLHGITMLVESEPRFPITWVHAGFVEFIERNGTTAPGLDTRWSWPGFFALAAFWAGSGDLHALMPALTAMPVVDNLLYLAALGLLMRAIWMSWQAKWLTAMLFCLLNWVGQDYFSPQGATMVFYLLFLAFLVVWFRSPPGVGGEGPRGLRWGRRLWQRVWRDALPGELPPGPSSSSERVVVLAVLVGLFIAATVCHQLTPFAMIISVAGLVIARRCTLSGLPVLLTVILMAWISYLTQAYWGSNLGEVMSGVGDVGGTVSDSVSERASLGGAERQIAINARIGTTLMVFAIAGLGLLRRRRRGIEDRVLLVLASAPVGLALMQSYGGEIALRVYFFALAPLCVLAALALFPHPVSRPSLLQLAVACAFTLALTCTFFITRYGNEAFERMPSGAVDAVEALYAQTTGNVRLVYVTAVPDLTSTPFLPLGFREVERVHWKNTMAPADPTDVTAVLQTVRDQGPGTYLITARSQEAFIEFGQGYPADWAERFRAAMAGSEGVRVVVENPDATIYTLDWPPDAAPYEFEPLETGVQVWRTPWTPLGVALLAMLVTVVGARETRRARLAPSEQNRLRPVAFAAIPLFIAFMLVVLERFLLLTS